MTISAGASCCRRAARSISGELRRARRCATNSGAASSIPIARSTTRVSSSSMSSMPARSAPVRLPARSLSARAATPASGALPSAAAAAKARARPRTGQRFRSLGRDGLEGRRREFGQARPAGQGQPPHHPKVLGGRASLSPAKCRQAGRVRQSLRRGLRPHRHDRRPFLRVAGGRGDRGSRDRLFASCGQPLFLRRPDTLRRPAHCLGRSAPVRRRSKTMRARSRATMRSTSTRQTAGRRCSRFLAARSQPIDVLRSRRSTSFSGSSRR